MATVAVVRCQKTLTRGLRIGEVVLVVVAAVELIRTSAEKTKIYVSVSGTTIGGIWTGEAIETNGNHRHSIAVDLEEDVEEEEAAAAEAEDVSQTMTSSSHHRKHSITTMRRRRWGLDLGMKFLRLCLIARQIIRTIRLTA